MVSRNRLFKDETPGKGRIVFDKGVKIKKKEDEIRIARWLIGKYGGEYKILNESKNLRRKTPDILRNNTVLIETKTVSSETSFKNRLDEAIDQLSYKYNKIAKISIKYVVLEMKGTAKVTDRELRKVAKLKMEGKNVSEITGVILKRGNRSIILW